LLIGIRHHGPGSSRSLLRALDDFAPDLVLIEGPPDGQNSAPFAAHPQMEPPVALLVYAPDTPRHAAFFPFAVFSPEWQALRWAQKHRIESRFADLPHAHHFALDAKDQAAAEAQAEAATAEAEINTEEVEADPAQVLAPGAAEVESAVEFWRGDPLKLLAEAAGYEDSERWWEDMVEHRCDGVALFHALAGAMAALRERIEEHEAQQLEDGTLPPQVLAEREREALREAWMRVAIRTAQKEGFERIAFVCGAWHVPALQVLGEAKTRPREDAALLKGLPKMKVSSTWIPWTNGRLCAASGYGAGIASPGWYGHLWSHPNRPAVRWMSRVAALLRESDLDASPAHVIEAVRLAEALAALRERPLPGLEEMNEATQTVLCFGSDAPLKLISDKLIVGEVLGKVPDDTPTVPLQADLQTQQKTLRIKPEASWRDLHLDLRKPTDLSRSHLLHRLQVLGVAWGELLRSGGGASTFHEDWRIQWKPELSLAVIEASLWGNTVESAAGKRAVERAQVAETLPALTALLESVRLSRLPEASRAVTRRLEEVAATSSDVSHLLEALAPLCNIARYGDVRGAGEGDVSHIIDGLLTRAAIGLPSAAANLNEEAASALAGHVESATRAIALVGRDGWKVTLRSALAQVLARDASAPLVAGKCCRLLLDAGSLDAEEVARHVSLALSRANEPARAGAWLEGFLENSAAILIHDERLWAVLDNWLCGVGEEFFTEVLPLLRRTFGTFAAPERRALLDRAKSTATAPVAVQHEFDMERANLVLPSVAELLGWELKAA
jgi:hypothetical protein